MRWRRAANSEVRWLEEHGKQARALETRFEGEGAEAEDVVAEDTAAGDSE